MRHSEKKTDQAHFVCEDTMLVMVPAIVKPCQPLELVNRMIVNHGPPQTDAEKTNLEWLQFEVLWLPLGLLLNGDLRLFPVVSFRCQTFAEDRHNDVFRQNEVVESLFEGFLAIYIGGRRVPGR